MASNAPSAQQSAYPQRINRAHSPVVARAVPWLSIMFGTLLPQWLTIASAPLVPPLGYLFLLAWRQLRPGVLPVWAGLPLGLFDDLYSGQPVGAGVVTWSVTMVALEAIEARFPWRSAVMDWLVAALFIAGYLLAGLIVVDASGATVRVEALLPQVLLAILLFPLAGRFVGWLDRLRLVRFRAFG